MTFETVGDLLILYLKLLLLALLVERLMEVLVSAWEFVEWKRALHRAWNRRAERLRRRLETQAHRSVFSRVLRLTPLARQARSYTRAANGLHRGNLILLDGQLVRRVAITTGCRVVATVIGVLLCWVAGINIVALIQTVATTPGGALSTLLGGIPEWLQLLASGILVGMGSEPLHHLIQNLERRRERRAERERLEQAQLETAKATAAASSASNE